MKNLIRAFAEKVGVKILRNDAPMRSLEMGLSQVSKLVSPTYIIDVGVDYGSPELYKTFPSTKYKYILIEADPANATVLTNLAKQLNARSENVFCGPQEGSVTLYFSNNHAYSSAYLKDREGFNKVKVPVKTLDSITKTERDSRASFLLKIDVEGAELDVLRGSVETLKNTAAVVTEVSVARKFDGGAEFADIVGFLKEQGFSIFDLCSGFDLNGKLYQLDAIFVKTDAPFR